MQAASSRIWTQSTMSISYDDNHNTTSTSSPLAVSLREFIPFSRVSVQKWTYEQDWSLNSLTMTLQYSTLATMFAYDNLHKGKFVDKLQFDFKNLTKIKLI